MANKRKFCISMETTVEKSDSGNIDVEEKKVKSNGDEEDFLVKINKEDQIKSAKAKIGEVREENGRLKQLLFKIVKDYKSLQKHFCEVAQEEDSKEFTKINPIHQENEEPELVSLSLGPSSSEAKKEEKKISNLSDGNNNEDEKLKINKGLSLGLDCKFEANSTVSMKNPSSESSLDKEIKEEETTEAWPPSKVLKTSISAEDEDFQQTQMKKTRVSIRARCDAPTMSDGCQWRKYGQKIAKGNPCPRAYYRCTISPTCPVRKQVQRCAEDMAILMTTYEGTHNHPLPVSATAMASTTSAAASMLQSRSSTSQPGLISTSISAPYSISIPSNGLNFTLTQTSKPQQFYFPNSSISNSNSHPTVTVDLTTSNFDRFSPAPRSSPTCLNFSSNADHLQTLRNHVGYPTHTNQSLSLNNIGQSYKQLNNNPTSSCDQETFTNNIAAATEMIAGNTAFRSALAAAITSIVGFKDNNNLDQKAGHNGIGCGSSYLNNSPSNLNSHQKQESLVLFPNSSPFRGANNASGSPANNRDPKDD